MTAFPATVRAALAALLLSVPAIAAAAEITPIGATPFVTGMGDVPAMPGLRAAENGALVFDKPGGRIVESVMQGAVERKAVLGFYAQTMPQLGWKRVTDTRYERDGEELRLEFPGAARKAGQTPPAQAGQTPPAQAGQTIVQFVLKPR